MKNQRFNFQTKKKKIMTRIGKMSDTIEVLGDIDASLARINETLKELIKAVKEIP